MPQSVEEKPNLKGQVSECRMEILGSSLLPGFLYLVGEEDKACGPASVCMSVNTNEHVHERVCARASV